MSEKITETPQTDEKENLKKDPLFGRYHSRLHLTVDIINDTYVFFCGRRSKNGGYTDFYFDDSRWCPKCHKEYARQVKEGTLPEKKV